MDQCLHLQCYSAHYSWLFVHLCTHSFQTMASRFFGLYYPWLSGLTPPLVYQLPSCVGDFDISYGHCSAVVLPYCLLTPALDPSHPSSSIFLLWEHLTTTHIHFFSAQGGHHSITHLTCWFPSYPEIWINQSDRLPILSPFFLLEIPQSWLNRTLCFSVLVPWLGEQSTGYLNGLCRTLVFWSSFSLTFYLLASFTLFLPCLSISWQLASCFSEKSDLNRWKFPQQSPPTLQHLCHLCALPGVTAGQSSHTILVPFKSASFLPNQATALLICFYHRRFSYVVDNLHPRKSPGLSPCQMHPLWRCYTNLLLILQKNK